MAEVSPADSRRRVSERLKDRTPVVARVIWMAAAGLLCLAAGCSSTGTAGHSGGMASTNRMTARQMCTEAGGTYSSGGCQPSTATMSTRLLCEARVGYYFEGGDYCEVPAAGLRR